MVLPWMVHGSSGGLVIDSEESFNQTNEQRMNEFARAEKYVIMCVSDGANLAHGWRSAVESNLRVLAEVQRCPKCNSAYPFLAALGPHIGPCKPARWLGPYFGPSMAV